MTSANEARTIIVDQAPKMPAEVIPLLQAHRRILAKDVAATQDIPLFDNSSMDGFALQAVDTITAQQSAPILLNVVGEILAGGMFPGVLPSRSAARIMTGAPIPWGADAVLEQEAVTTKNGSVNVAMAVNAGRNIRKRGEDIAAGSTVFAKGTLLQSAHLGVLASIGVVTVPVFRRPSVAFLTTGNELVNIEETPVGGQIRNSNAYSLWGLIQESGAIPYSLGTARDSEAELLEKLSEGLKYDLLLTSGGVSVGTHDLVLSALKQLGVEVRFWKVNIKPGMPLVFGVYRHHEHTVPVFGLPGNPVSTMVTFQQFVRPALLAMMGSSNDSTIRLKARMKDEFRKKDGKRHFIRGIVRNENGVLVVETTGTQSSGALTSMTKANCFVVIPEQRMEVHAGEEVEIELL